MLSKSKFLILSLLLIASMVFSPALAQETITPVINAKNIHQLKPVYQIDFSDLPAESGQVQNGWFALRQDGESLAVVNRANQIIFWDAIHGFSQPFSPFCPEDDGKPGTFVDGTFGPIGFSAAYISGGKAYTVVYAGENMNLSLICGWKDLPVRIWQTEDRIWQEMIPQDGITFPYITSLPVGADVASAQNLSTGPENDPDSFLRIGRIEPPFAVTITQTNTAQTWNLNQGTIQQKAQLPTLPGMGALTPDGRFFGWRDGDSEGLYLLDFSTRENHRVADLGGQYIPFLLISRDGDIMFSVDGAEQPNLIAWDTLTGERWDLGQRRSCNRQPDLVRISQDGTTLVIGCDQGIQIWRIINTA